MIKYLLRFFQKGGSLALAEGFEVILKDESFLEISLDN
jgi:hypothetical protein